MHTYNLLVWPKCIVIFDSLIRYIIYVFEYIDRFVKNAPAAKNSQPYLLYGTVLLVLWPLDSLFRYFFCVHLLIHFFVGFSYLSLGPFRLIHTVKSEAMFCFIFHSNILLPFVSFPHETISHAEKRAHAMCSCECV